MERNKDIEKLLKMINYAENTIKHINNISFGEFISEKDDILLVYSCFNILQIGEIVSNLDENIIQSYSNIDWKNIKGIRNRIVHDYDGIRFLSIWQIIQDDLPKLIIDLTQIITDLEKKQKGGGKL